MLLHVFCNGSLNTCRYEEILLFQTKLFTCHMVIIRIKHLADGTCQILLLYCLLIITLVKGIQIEGINCLRIPDTKCIYYIIVISNNRQIVRHCQN